MRRKLLLAASATATENSIITFYIDDQVDVIPMKALRGMTWYDFIYSGFSIKNEIFSNFRVFNMGSYKTVLFYHELALDDLFLYEDSGFQIHVKTDKVIEDGVTYYAGY